jgi:plastocyanin
MTASRRMAALAGAPGIALALACAGAAPAAPTVTIDGTRYAPETLKVTRGATVTWINKDPFPHTVTVAKAFDSKEIGANRSWKHVFKAPGRYDYICTLHPGMKGTLVVE